MNLAAAAPQWLVFLLVAMLVVAAIEDAIRLRIANLTCLGILVAGIVAIWIVGPQSALWQNAVVLVGILTVGTPLFAAGRLGGGDIKLLAVTGLWFDLQGAFLMLVSVLIAGGFLAIFLVGLRMSIGNVQTKEGARLLKRGGVIPYGVAIAGGAIFTIAFAALQA